MSYELYDNIMHVNKISTMVNIELEYHLNRKNIFILCYFILSIAMVYYLQMFIF